MVKELRNKAIGATLALSLLGCSVFGDGRAKEKETNETYQYIQKVREVLKGSKGEVCGLGDGYLGTTVSKEDIEKSARIFRENLKPVLNGRGYHFESNGHEYSGNLGPTIKGVTIASDLNKDKIVSEDESGQVLEALTKRSIEEIFGGEEFSLSLESLVDFANVVFFVEGRLGIEGFSRWNGTKGNRFYETEHYKDPVNPGVMKHLIFSSDLNKDGEVSPTESSVVWDEIIGSKLQE